MKLKTLNLSGAVIGLSLLAVAYPKAETSSAWFASDLIGMKVLTTQGEDFGKIEDIVVHPGSNGSYAVLSFGDWSPMENKLVAMPWSALRTETAGAAHKDGDRKVGDRKDGDKRDAGMRDTDNEHESRTLVLTMDKARLQQAPSFEKKSWPNLNESSWSKELDAFFGGNETRPAKGQPVEASARKSVLAWRYSQLDGTDVKTPTGDKLGDINEVVIDANGRVSYVALSVGGFLGMGDRLVPVPWGALEFSRVEGEDNEQAITLASTKELLKQAPEFKKGKDNSAQMRDPEWISRVYAYFGQTEYDAVKPIGGANY